MVVVPVKASAVGKSRLDVPGVDRGTLARAIALDTIAAAAEVADVVVVTDDSDVAASVPPGVRVVADPGTGLNSAIAAGADVAGERMPRAALLGDVPALRPADLRDALSAAADHPRAVVTDAEGTGSTLVTAVGGVPWRSAFGADSFARHVALGCTALALPEDSSLRRDVDTAGQLAAAAALGLGPRTARLIARR